MASLPAEINGRWPLCEFWQSLSDSCNSQHKPLSLLIDSLRSYRVFHFAQDELRHVRHLQVLDEEVERERAS